MSGRTGCGRGPGPGSRGRGPAADAGPEGRAVATGDHALWVRDAGVGEPVLLLHGFTNTGSSWDGIAARLRAAGRRTLAPDLVGHGRSAVPGGVASYTMARCADDLAALLDACGLRSAHVVGYSMGGRVALAFAAAHPARVRTLVTVGASAGIADPAERAARRESDAALADAILRDGVAAFVARWMRQPLFSSQRRLGAAALARMETERLAQPARGLALSLRGMGAGAQAPLHAELPGLPMPALFVAGAEDAKFVRLAHELAAAVPGARAAVVPEAGHAAHLEQPDAFHALLRDFLACHPIEGMEAIDTLETIDRRRP